MKIVRRLLIASVACGLASLVFFIFGRLAMTDIFHGEPDLTLEWRIVSIGFLPILFFHLLSVVAASLAIRFIGRSNSGTE